MLVISTEALSATSFELSSLEKQASDNGRPSLEIRHGAELGVEKVSSSIHQANTTDAHQFNAASTEKSAAIDEAEIAEVDTTPSHRQNHDYKQPEEPSTTEATLTSLLAAIAQSQLRTEGSSQLPRASEASMLRVRRHREIAALFERLGELYREEAKEFLPPDEIRYGPDFFGQ